MGPMAAVAPSANARVTKAELIVRRAILVQWRKTRQMGVLKIWSRVMRTTFYTRLALA